MHMNHQTFVLHLGASRPEPMLEARAWGTPSIALTNLSTLIEASLPWLIEDSLLQPIGDFMLALLLLLFLLLLSPHMLRLLLFLLPHFLNFLS